MQISAEAPSFNTAAAEKEMQIYGEFAGKAKCTKLADGKMRAIQSYLCYILILILPLPLHSTVLPTDRPVLRINKTQGRPGDQVYVSCISSKSKPAGTLGLFINGEPVSVLGEFKLHFTAGGEWKCNNSSWPVEQLVDENKKIEREFDANGLESTILRMAFVLTPEHFKYGSVKLKCISSMSDVYLMTHETIVEIYNQDEVEERARALASEQITEEGDSQGEFAGGFKCQVPFFPSLCVCSKNVNGLLGQEKFNCFASSIHSSSREHSLHPILHCSIDTSVCVCPCIVLVEVPSTEERSLA